jgi:hypothetical protein
VINPLHSNYRVGLSYALLFMIAYAALVETVHSHGYINLRQTNIAAISDAGGAQSSTNAGSHQKDCSLCQFQRQLFDGLVQATLFARVPQTEAEFVSTLTVPYRSTPITSRSGRAPPRV